MTIDIPRDRVSWFPTIDYDACVADRACLDFCHSDVFRWDEAEARVEVVNPHNCVLGCTSCAQICPVEAISFPDKEELRRTLRRIRAETRVSKLAAPAAESRGEKIEEIPSAVAERAVVAAKRLEKRTRTQDSDTRLQLADLL